MVEQALLDALLQGGAAATPMSILLFIVWRELQQQSRTLIEIKESIAYWGKRGTT